jgi:hypothetical protein
MLAARGKAQDYLRKTVTHITNLSSKISAEGSGNTYQSGVLFRVATPGNLKLGGASNGKHWDSL